MTAVVKTVSARISTIQNLPERIENLHRSALKTSTGEPCKRPVSPE
jgi:hypothetical protein